MISIEKLYDKNLCSHVNLSCARDETNFKKFPKFLLIKYKQIFPSFQKDCSHNPLQTFFDVHWGCIWNFNLNFISKTPKNSLKILIKNEENFMGLVRRNLLPTNCHFYENSSSMTPNDVHYMPFSSAWTQTSTIFWEKKKDIKCEKIVGVNFNWQFSSSLFY